jgi:hypothetical protein
MNDALREDEEVLIALLGEYVSRRDGAQDTRLPELVARAAEFGDPAKLKLIALVALYEALRIPDDE